MERETMESSSGLRERKKTTENPPTNDCCPVCFDDFIFPCRTNCNHWFCANCILEYWQHGVAALKPCKCPFCSINIKRLTPEASLCHSQDPKAVEAMKRINQYNRLFVGGIHGLLVRAREFPWLMKRLLQDMMDPDRYDYYLNKVQWVAMLMGMLLSEVIPSPTDRISLPVLFECIAVVLFLIMQLTGFNRRRQQRQRVRQLHAINQEQDQRIQELDQRIQEQDQRIQEQDQRIQELRQRKQELLQRARELGANHP